MINPQLELSIDGLTLYAIYGNVFLGLRHPENKGHSRLVALTALEKIGATLVDSGMITASIRFEHEKGLTRWARDYNGI